MIEHCWGRREIPDDTPDFCLGLLGVAVGVMGVRFEGEDVELGWNMLRLGDLWAMVSGVQRALVHWAPTTFQALCLAWTVCCVSSAFKFGDEGTEAQRD